MSANVDEDESKRHQELRLGGNGSIPYQAKSQQQQQPRIVTLTTSRTALSTSATNGSAGGKGAGYEKQAGTIVGICEDMCPAVERERRSRLSDIQIFERLDPQISTLTSAELAVKRFARTIDDSNNAPEFFRTRKALSRTMAHLRDLLDRKDARLGLIHKFLWDRYRSVRQDLYVQGISDEFSVNVYEQVVRFHLLSEHELCEEEESVTEMEGFNSHLNMEQMNKALISLNDMYNKLAAAGRPMPTEPEFRAYHLVSLMGQHGKYKGDQQAFLSMLQAMRPIVRRAPSIQWVLKLQSAFADGDFVRFFKLVRLAPYLMACLSHVYFGQIRSHALRMLAETLTPKAGVSIALELHWLMETLMLNSVEEAHRLCAMHGYKTSMQGAVAVVLLTKGVFVDPPPPIPRTKSKFITRKAPTKRSLAIINPCLHKYIAEGPALKEEQRLRQLHSPVGSGALFATSSAKQWHPEGLTIATAESALMMAQMRANQQQNDAAWLSKQPLCSEEISDLNRQQVALRLLPAKQQRQELGAGKGWQRGQLPCQGEEQQQATVEAKSSREGDDNRRWQKATDVVPLKGLDIGCTCVTELRQEHVADTQARHLWAVQHCYLSRWRLAARRSVEARQRQQRITANIKGCKVTARKQVAELAGPPAASDSRCLLTGLTTAGAATTSIDLRSLMAPLLLQHSPTAGKLYWKLVLVPPHTSFAGNLCTQEQHLHSWLTLQMQNESWSRRKICDTSMKLAASLQTVHSCIADLVEMEIYLASPARDHNDDRAAALAGASGVVLAVHINTPDAHEMLRWITLWNKTGTPLPVLLVTASDEAAQYWQQVIRLQYPSPGLVCVVSVEVPLAGHLDSDSCSIGYNQQQSQLATYSTQRLMHGLRWLAANSPPQPVLQVVPLETAVLAALAATSASLHCSSPGVLDGLAGAQLHVNAFEQGLAFVEQAATFAYYSEAACWQWPPPELAPAALCSWHETKTFQTIISGLKKLSLDAAQLMHMSNVQDICCQSLMLETHVHLAANEAGGFPPLVLPQDVAVWLHEQLEAIRASSSPFAALRGNHQHKPFLETTKQGHKRKWQSAGSVAPASADQHARLAPAATCYWEKEGCPAGSDQGTGEQVVLLPSEDGRLAFGVLKQNLLSERHCELGLQYNVVLAAAGTDLGSSNLPYIAYADPFEDLHAHP